MARENSAEGRVHQAKDGSLMVVEIQHGLVNVTAGFIERYVVSKK
jgi:hypothetical protein